MSAFPIARAADRCPLPLVVQASRLHSQCARETRAPQINAREPTGGSSGTETETGTETGFAPSVVRVTQEQQKICYQRLSLPPQGFDRVDAPGAPGGHEAGDEGHAAQKDGGEYEGRRIEDGGFVEQ